MSCPSEIYQQKHYQNSVRLFFVTLTILSVLQTTELWCWGDNWLLNWKDHEREGLYPNFRYYPGNYTEDPRSNYWYPENSRCRSRDSTLKPSESKKWTTLCIHLCTQHHNVCQLKLVLRSQNILWHVPVRFISRHNTVACLKRFFS